MTEFQRRILAYLVGKGGTAHRYDIMCDLAPPDSRSAKRGISQQAARAVGAWTAPMIKHGWVKSVNAAGYYAHHEITAAGREALRKGAPS